MSEQTLEILDEDRCWELLESHEYGRLAFAVANDPDICPVNYHARGRKLYVRTSAGSKLLGVTINHKVAFEFDQIRPHEAVSVILYGTVRELDSPEEREFFESLPLHPWVSTEKYHYLEISGDEISGRRFRLGGESPA
ncbi:Pyridoxamine 5'-phosphate oxidase [Austwickia chelonae]|uniref:Pyridoxamine 5'-phosphate oxidase putative domain-containing protein n=1 Tax=Austwickia chelonae NBRC 105200 TaxID=1184607 RepID=K6W974_9MICO|nr:pyridoxamine 5'-phosphate oxidase family protein [Austwickia chelonae]GAB78392.1 hypothetical protein AUCHE_08_06400 [Austwickia chelonae NBRC 105200]SEW02686.1 Pyridoxamine 5'-phosphate oxidase [Austwickia chelonae]